MFGDVLFRFFAFVATWMFGLECTVWCGMVNYIGFHIAFDRDKERNNKSNQESIRSTVFTWLLRFWMIIMTI